MINNCFHYRVFNYFVNSYFFVLTYLSKMINLKAVTNF